MMCHYDPALGLRLEPYACAMAARRTDRELAEPAEAEFRRLRGEMRRLRED